MSKLIHANFLDTNMGKTYIEKHFDEVAPGYDSGKKKYSYYYSSLKKLLRKLIGKDKTVFEFGCGTGDLLASLKPKKGVGCDISQEMISISKSKYRNFKNLTFSTKLPKEKFEYIFMSDVIEHLQNPERDFENLSKRMDKKSKLIITMANPTWEPLLMVWENLGWKMKEGPHRRLTADDLQLMINKAQLKIVKHDYTLLVPVKIPLITDFANKYLEPMFKPLCFTEYFVVTLK